MRYAVEEIRNQHDSVAVGNQDLFETLDRNETYKLLMSTAKLVAEATCAHKQSAQTAYNGFLDILRDLERGSNAGKDPNWEGMTVAQLKQIRTQNQLKHNLIARLITAGVQFPNEANATGRESLRILCQSVPLLGIRNTYQA
jgi:hypothetical protein